MPRWCSLLILWTSPALITAGTITFWLFVNAARVGAGSQRPGWPIVVAGLGVWCLHVGYLLAPWLWGRGHTTLGLWLMTPVAFIAMAFWLFFLGRLIFSEPSSNPDLSHKLLWILGLLAGLLAYLGPIATLLMSRETWLNRLVATPAFAVTLAVLANLSGLVASLFLLVMLMASGANSTPAQITLIKQLMLAVSVVALLGLGGGVWSLVMGRSWLAAGLGFFPCLFAVSLVTIAFKLKF